MISASGRERLLAALLLASAFALGSTRVGDTDAWTHLALGRDIATLGWLPATERFDFPSLEMPYYNPSWLFGLVLYLAYLAGGFAGVVALKAAVVTLAFLVLFKDARVPLDPPSHRLLGSAAVVPVLALALVAARYRFVERPDIALMGFLGFTVYALTAYVWEGRRALYLLPLVQVLWVNVHQSMLVGLIPYGAWLVGGWLQGLVERRWGVTLPGTPSPRQLRTIALVLASVLAASLLNPYGVEPFLAPFRLVGAPWLRHEVMELQPPRLADYPVAFALAGLLVAALLVGLRRVSIVSVMLVAPFAYLALSARRFVFLLVVVTAPILARHVRGLLGRLAAERAEWLGRPAAALAAVVVVALGTLGATGTRPFADALRVPGFGAHHVSVPEGALGYLDRIGLAGNVFNIFQWGGYMAWRDYPRRLPFVDGRGYVPAGMLDEMMAVRADPVRLARLQARYGFDAAIVDYPRNPIADETPDVDLGLTSPHWALVYWDDLSMVYLRRTEALAAVIARDEYRHVKPAMGAGYLRRHVGDASRLAAIETELRRNVAETRSSTGYALLGFVYNEAGRFREAIAELTLVGDFPYGSNLLNAYLGLAFAYGRLGDLRQSIDHYRRAIRLQEDPLTLHNAGLTVEKLGDDREAARYFERALALDRHLVPTYPALIRVSRRAGREDRVRELEAGYTAALAHGEAEAHFKRGVKLYFEGKIHDAIVEFRASVKSNPRHAATRSNLGFAYYDVGRLDDAFAEQRSALDVDPGFANAHYGLALVHRERGDAPAAREHFGRYLALAPKGYWARKAQTALDGLASRR